MKYLAYRVYDAGRRPGAVVCREFTDEEHDAAKASKDVCGGVHVFEAATRDESWETANGLLVTE